MPALKCPSPTCPFLFDPTSVPPGAMVACPRCGLKFLLGPPVDPSRAAPPVAESTRSPEPTSALPQTSPDPEPQPKQPSNRPMTRHPGSSDGVAIKLLLIGGLMLAAILAGSAVLYFFLPASGSRGNNEFGSEFRVVDKNFSFARPPFGWESDNATRAAMNLTALAYRRTDLPEAWVALSVTDYDTRTPFVSELKEKMLDHLNRGFENVPAEVELQPYTWSGQQAQSARFRLQAKGDDAPIILDATFLTYRGWAYWCYTWARQEDFDSVAEDLEKLRQSFQLLDGRSKRTAPPVREYVYRNKSGKYKLKNYENIWAEPKGLTGSDLDPKGDLFLKAQLSKSGSRDRRPSAELLVLVLDDAGEASEVAERYIRERHKRNEEDLGQVQLVESTSEPTGDEALGPAEPKNPVVRWRMSRGTNETFRTADKLIVFSAIRLGNQVVIAEGSCPWNEREHWERRLIQLAGSLQP